MDVEPFYIRDRLAENNDLSRKGSGKRHFFSLVSNALTWGGITRHPQDHFSASYFQTQGFLQIGNIIKTQFRWEKALGTNIPSIRCAHWLRAGRKWRDRSKCDR